MSGCWIMVVGTLALASGPCLAAGNSLLNGGFEDGLASWTTDYGAIRFDSPPPYCGDQYLMGGAEDGAAKSYTYQTVTLAKLGLTAQEVDAGAAAVEYGGWQAGYEQQQDRGKIELIFRDANHAPISSVDLGWFYSASEWTLLSGEADVPVKTRSITFGFHAERFAGINNDGYLDSAYLVAVGGCYADFTDDGLLDLFDFLSFVNAFNAGDEAADCDQNCAMDLFDFLCFTNSFNAGC
jgi:hypothetical protein